MLRPLAALLAVSAGAEAHRMRLGENGHGVRGFVAPAEGKPEEHHRPGQPGRMGGWFDRMGAARDALQAQGMEFSWEPSSQGGRAVTFVDGESVACIATSPSAAHNDDTVVLIAGSRMPPSRPMLQAIAGFVTGERAPPAPPPAPLTTAVLRCADDAAYTSTGRATLRIPSQVLAVTASATEGARLDAMLVVAEEEEEVEGAPKHAALLSTARYAIAPSSATAAAAGAAAGSAAGSAAAEARSLSEPSTTTTTTTTTTSGDAPVVMAGCGGEGQPQCETAEEKAKDEKVQEGEANFALAVAFVGCIAIVRAANKYARDPS